MRQPKTGRIRLKNREQIAQALDLRKAGASLQQVADRMGLGSRQRAHQIINLGLSELNAICQEEAETVRRLELERLDGLLLSLYPQRSNPRVADTILRTMERRAKLLGLDAPTKATLELQDPECLIISRRSDG